MRRRGPAAGKPQTSYVGRPLAPLSVCAAGARRLESPNLPSLDALSSCTMNMCSRDPAAGKPQPTYVGRPLALLSVYTDGARRLESPKTTYVGGPPILLSVCSRGPAAKKPQTDYVGHSTLCHQSVQQGPDGWRARTYLRRMPLRRSPISRRSRGTAAGKPQPTYVGCPSALLSVYTDGARRLESPKTTLLGLPLLCYQYAH